MEYLSRTTPFTRSSPFGRAVTEINPNANIIMCDGILPISKQPKYAEIYHRLTKA